MPRAHTVKLAVVTLALPMATVLAACGHSSSTHSSSSSSTTSAKSSSSSSASSGNCAAGFVSAQIAGQPKCLQNGQQCQDQNASDYKKYGFTCTKTNGREQLQKK